MIFSTKYIGAVPAAGAGVAAGAVASTAVDKIGSAVNRLISGSGGGGSETTASVAGVKSRLHAAGTAIGETVRAVVSAKTRVSEAKRQLEAFGTEGAHELITRAAAAFESALSELETGSASLDRGRSELSDFGARL